jgi:hypothetical protein
MSERPRRHLSRVRSVRLVQLKWKPPRAAPPLWLETRGRYVDTGFQASYLIFSTPGCWEVTAQVGDRGLHDYLRPLRSRGGVNRA